VNGPWYDGFDGIYITATIRDYNEGRYRELVVTFSRPSMNIVKNRSSLWRVDGYNGLPYEYWISSNYFNMMTND